MPNLSEVRKALHKMTTSVTTTSDGPYQLSFLWKEEHPQLPRSIGMAKNRLCSVKRSLLKEQTLKAKYTEVVETYLSKEHAQRVNPEANDDQSSITWYLPHHPVINPHKSKIRVVFDCAAKVSNPSLNDKLLRGPDLMNSLVGDYQAQKGADYACR